MESLEEEEEEAMTTEMVVGKGFGLCLEATELRLGPPGDGEMTKNSGKRGFSETIDLKLKLKTVHDADESGVETEKMERSPSQKNVHSENKDPEKPPAKYAFFFDKLVSCIFF